MVKNKKRLALLQTVNENLYFFKKKKKKKKTAFLKLETTKKKCSLRQF